MGTRNLKSSVSRVTSPPKALGENLSLPLPVPGGSCFTILPQITPVSFYLHMAFFPLGVSVSRSPSPLSYKVTRFWI